MDTAPNYYNDIGERGLNLVDYSYNYSLEMSLNFVINVSINTMAGLSTYKRAGEKHGQ